MPDPAASFLDSFAARFQPTGVFGTLEDDRRSAAIALTFAALAPVLVVAFVVAFAVSNETQMLWVSLLVLVVDAVALPLLVRTGSLRLYGLLGAWRLVVAGIAGHILLGGFLWSGGYLWFGGVAAILAALVLPTRDTLSLGAVPLTAGLLFAPVEGALRQSREEPALGLSVFILVSLGAVTLTFAGTLILLLVRRVHHEHARNQALMLSILPSSIADRLKSEPGMIANRYDACTIVFADLVGFTAHSKGKDPAHLVGELNTIFTRFDALAAQHGAEKIKTIGDGYMAATGLPDPDSDHVTHACDLALAMLDAMPALNAELGTDFALRVGVNTGSAVAGVVGTSKFSYDVWGDTVNLASRLESSGVPGVVAVSASVVQALDDRHTVEPLGTRALKGQGPTEIYRLTTTRRVPA